ncbi:MAG: patatin-like phospholipase family protein [Pseudomonadota bacterium]|nr:patatin-like phospholipase family protein [Pseudomonadota bacterium]
MFRWRKQPLVSSAVGFDKVVEAEPSRTALGTPPLPVHPQPAKTPPAPPFTAPEVAAALGDIAGEIVAIAGDAEGNLTVPSAPTVPTSQPVTRAPQPCATKGIALSGGGIRSATFSLGVLQSLAKHQQLSKFDYLSTVSGGGYIGSWLSAWISREGLPRVEAALGNCSSAGNSQPVSGESPPVTWLRKYSNYLAPRVGLLSIDSLTLISIWVRNVLLNMTIVISFIVTMLLIPRLILRYVPSLVDARGLMFVADVFGLLILPMMICINLTNVTSQIQRFSIGQWLMKVRGVVLTVIFPGLTAAILGSFSFFGRVPKHEEPWYSWQPLPGIMLGLVAILFILLKIKRRSPKTTFWESTKPIAAETLTFVCAALATAALMLALLYSERGVFFPQGASEYFDYVRLLVLGPPAFLVTFGLGGFIFVGLAGRAYFERSREWWSRLNAWFILIGTAWFFYMATSFYAAPLTEWAHASYKSWFTTLAGCTWAGGLITALLGSRTKNLSNVVQVYLFVFLNFAAYIVISEFVIAIAFGTDFTLNQLVDKVVGATQHERPGGDITFVQFFQSSATHLKLLEASLFDGWPIPVLAFFASLVVLLAFGWRVDVNKFSLHNMYKNRLIRAYLGASRTRRPQPFDGFDEDDDLPMTTLGDQRPFHIINTTLNISQGKNLAWQERKGASFVFTPLYCGFSLAKSQGDSSEQPDTSTGVTAAMPSYDSIPGYQLTAKYAEDESNHAITLGTAMAVSGAAASPNMGAMTRPALAFVLTLFNARLGRWCSNPSKKKWDKVGPKFGLVCFLQELFGWSNEDRNFVYLSDGGHFDNLGLYELIRRRCSTIWLIDASADPRRACEDLGRAIRQCRVDFGVEIDLPLMNITTNPPALLPHAGHAEGTIDYGTSSAPGRIIYIKPTLCQGLGEPDDVLSYSKREHTFPHQTTADQFFDESQFESYRRLGLHIVDTYIALKKAANLAIP